MTSVNWPAVSTANIQRRPMLARLIHTEVFLQPILKKRLMLARFIYTVFLQPKSKDDQRWPARCTRRCFYSQYPKTTNVGLLAVQGCFYSQYPKTTNVGPLDIHGRVSAANIQRPVLARSFTQRCFYSQYPKTINVGPLDIHGRVSTANT